MTTKQARLGERIRLLREATGLTQAECAARLTAEGAGVNQAFISQVERGEKSVSLETLVALARLLEVSADYLLGLDDDPTPSAAGEEIAVLHEPDPVRRAAMQQIFITIERLPQELRLAFYDALNLTFLGIMHKRRERSR